MAIISDDNSDAYADRFVLKGKVTFAARNVTIAATEDASQPSVMGDVSFIPNFERLSPSSDVYGLNLYEPYDAHPEGSIFLPNYRTVLPFEAYTTSVNAARAMINIGKLIGDDAETDIQGVRFFSGDSDGHYYNLQGQRIDEPKRKGVYLRKGKKVIMK